MKDAVGDVPVHHVVYGEGRPVLVLHGAGVDHREAAACFEPGLSALGHPGDSLGVDRVGAFRLRAGQLSRWPASGGASSTVGTYSRS